ncbi:MAG: phosphoribosylformylglycinamidine cyclo-ligase [Candidatus Omnitrophica bacterium]|nr:phosphoribosylformylglycinamidine cyclo-ligase [Candidatus Omnitrophota bacterium]
MAKPLTYKKSGVDIDKANDFVKRITPLIEKTRTKGTLGTIGGFGGFFKADFAGMKNPVLVSSTDGVGTKLLIANYAGKFDTVGIDLVAMCVNDIITCGARPLFFLDYFATGQIDADRSVDIIKGITNGCKEAGCALIGGETAEMPGLYKKEDFDLAGFCVGVVDRKNAIDGSGVKDGDRILGLASSGIHSNGYSLVRKVFSKKEMGGKYKKELLKPTTIYVKPVLDLIKNLKVKAIANITGGGFYDNIPRVLPDRTAASIDKDSWRVPPIFETINKRAKLPDEELYRTFNMGIGMIVVLDKDEIRPARERLSKYAIRSWDIGEVIKWAKKEVIL